MMQLTLTTTLMNLYIKGFLEVEEAIEYPKRKLHYILLRTYFM